ncbi:MAG: class I SAM-dependent methyltransferase [Nitrospirae bacterium]|nr:class I SAM-dependent methyltransferase [Candidatus Sumerlaeota bacterium]MBI3610857.1 class I SAM-dependent methyltransferase [Nitrospirota bacterium]
MRNPYNLIAEKWYAERKKLFREKKYVDILLQQLMPGAKILDLGCGAGEPIARYLLRQGFRVVGVDRSEKMLELAKRLIPQADLIHADMLEVDFDDRFAAIIAWDSIFHTERRHHQAIFGKLHKWLEPGGWLLLSVGGSASEDGEGFTSEMFGQTFFYSGYAPEESIRLLEAEGFQIKLWKVDDPSSRGHVAIIARKKA